MSTHFKNNNNQNINNNNLKRERVSTTNSNEIGNKKTKYEIKVNICNFCRKEPFTYKHLDECIPYFSSEKYKSKNINENNMKNSPIQKK